MSDQVNLNKYIMDVREWLSNVIGLIASQQFERDLDINEEAKKIKDLLVQLEEYPSKETLLLVNKYVEKLNDGLTNFEKMRSEGPMDYRRVNIGEHTLPPLPYRYDALEPYISEEIMRLHHDKHHKSYVDGLNKAEKMMKKARETGDYELIKHWEREAAFNGSGHYLHTIFWNVMSPNGGGSPKGRLRDQINQDFGSFELFKRHFSEVAKSAEGVGWAILVWSPRAGRLEILQAERHQFMTQWDTIPLLVLDVWEHAYYLQYKNERKIYVDNWWNIVNWKTVEDRFNKASKLRWQEY